MDDARAQVEEERRMREGLCVRCGGDDETNDAGVCGPCAYEAAYTPGDQSGLDEMRHRQEQARRLKR